MSFTDLEEMRKKARDEEKEDAEEEEATVVSRYLADHPDFVTQWLQKQQHRRHHQHHHKTIQSPTPQQQLLLAPSSSSSTSITDRLRRPSPLPSGDEDDDFSAAEDASHRSSVVPRSSRKSVTRDLFHQWLAAPRASSAGPPNNSNIGGASSSSRGHEVRSSLEIMEQNDRLMELILDISNELDIDVLCHKILLNVGHLTKADRCSLFLARGPRECRYLEAKLFDVDSATDLDAALARAKAEEITIPFGVGICGLVAQTKETVILKDAYKDPRFNREIDIRTGYKTHSLVCMPVCNFDGEVIGVAQIMNKRNSNNKSSSSSRRDNNNKEERDKEEEGGDNDEFTEEDLKVFERYLTFCGIGIQNAQLFEVSILEYKKNQLLLSLARNMFQEQMSLERLVSTIISEAKVMLKCERCTVYLLDLHMYDEMQMDSFHHSLTEPNAPPPPPPPLGSPPRQSITSLQSSVGGGGGPAEPPQPPQPPQPSQPSQPSSSSSTEIENQSPRRQQMQQQPSGSIESGGGGTTSRKVLQPLESEEVDESMSFQQAWETQGERTLRVYGQSDPELSQSRRAKIAKYVAATKEVLNLSNVANWLGEVSFQESDGFVPDNMLCVPIFNGQKDVIGVAQLINKTMRTKFTESDISLFEAFAIFCGIGIHNTKMYEGVCKLMAKQKVALDCLSYHASAADGDTDTLAKSSIPDANAFALYSYKFNDLSLTDDDTFKVCIRMFLEFGLIQHFQIPYRVLCRWVLSVKKNYRPVKYHNWRHGLNVCQTMFTVLKTGKMDRFMDDLEIFGLLVACLCHDLDHRGTNNAFQSKMDSPLAILYSTSTMEHHHFDQCVMILSSEGNNIFQGLSTDDYRRVMKIVEQAILSTDLALYFRKKDLFLETANKGEIDWQGEQKDLLCGMLMTACDVSAIAKPWELQHLVAKRVADEFFDQGDLEKLRLNTQPIAMMDRERKDELPKMQVGFIDVVCRPLYSSLSESFPWIKPLLDGCLANREKWADLAEKVEMGLTWIDHDTIDKPVEEITLGTAEAKDIEFKVETLKCGGASGASSGSAGSQTGPSRRESLMSKKCSFRSARSPAGRASGFFARRLSAKNPSNKSRSSAEQRHHDAATTKEAATSGDQANGLPKSSSDPHNVGDIQTAERNRRAGGGGQTSPRPADSIDDNREVSTVSSELSGDGSEFDSSETTGRSTAAAAADDEAKKVSKDGKKTKTKVRKVF